MLDLVLEFRQKKTRCHSDLFSQLRRGGEGARPNGGCQGGPGRASKEVLGRYDIRMAATFQLELLVVVSKV